MEGLGASAALALTVCLLVLRLWGCWPGVDKSAQLSYGRATFLACLRGRLSASKQIAYEEGGRNENCKAKSNG